MTTKADLSHMAGLLAKVRGLLIRSYAAVLKWDPNQPRNPAGSTDGGRWRSAGMQGRRLTDIAPHHREFPSVGTVARSVERYEVEDQQYHPSTRGGHHAYRSSTAAGMTRSWGPAGWADMQNLPKGQGFKNRPRAANFEPVHLKPGESPTMKELSTGTVESAESLGGGANATIKIVMDDGVTEGVFKPESGERWGGGFWNSSISKFVHNRKFSLAMREAFAWQAGDALLGENNPVPETVHRTEMEMPDDVSWNKNNDEAPYPDGGSIQHFIPLAEERDVMTQEQAAHFAVLDYVIGTMDRHPDNAAFSEDGRPLALDNGYSMPDTTEQGVVPAVDKAMAFLDSGGEGAGTVVTEKPTTEKPSTNELLKRYQSYKEGRYEEVADEVWQEMDNRFEEWVDARVTDIGERSEEIKKVWEELEDEFPNRERFHERVQPVLPMGSQPGFQRKTPPAIDPYTVIKETGIDTTGELSSEEKDTVRDYFREKLEANDGAGTLAFLELDQVRDEIRERDRDSWMYDHQDTQNRLESEKIHSFDSWKASQGIVDSDEANIDDSGFDSGSMPTSGSQRPRQAPGPDGFKFRSISVQEFLQGNAVLPESIRQPILDNIAKTDWEGLLARHPTMLPGEKGGFLGRLKKVTEALKTPEGLRDLWTKINRENRLE